MAASSADHVDWLAAEREALSRVRLSPEALSVGRVEEIADGIALVSGLPEARLSELLRFDGGRLGFASSLDPDAISAAILDEADAIIVGSHVSGDRRGGAGAGRRGAARPRRRSARPAARSRRADRGRGVSPDRTARRRRSSSARWSPSRSRPACWWSMRCLRSAADSASSSSAIAPPARPRSRSIPSSTRSGRTSFACMSRSASARRRSSG